MNYTNDFWNALEKLIDSSEIQINRPKGSAHPKYPNFIYSVDFGYLENTTSMDGDDIDIGGSTSRTEGINGIICTIDLMKKDSEIKILLNCTDTEIEDIIKLNNHTEFMKEFFIKKSKRYCHQYLFISSAFNASLICPYVKPLL